MGATAIRVLSNEFVSCRTTAEREPALSNAWERAKSRKLRFAEREPALRK